jgi:hypothetical protein
MPQTESARAGGQRQLLTVRQAGSPIVLTYINESDGYESISCEPVLTRLRTSVSLGDTLTSAWWNRRLPRSRTVQRTVLYLGEINGQQQAVLFGRHAQEQDHAA